MADYKQCSDASQKGPGTQNGLKSKKVSDPYVKGPKPTSSSPSGQTQSSSRGTDNKAK